MIYIVPNKKMKRYNLEREKLLNAILYFAKNVQNANKTKIFKLLYLIDFESFKSTGNSITGLDYYTWKFGPVPKSLFEEIEKMKPPSDFKKFLTIIEEWDEHEERKSFIFKAKKNPDMEVFSELEEEIIQRIVNIYRDVTAKDIMEITHLKNTPWEITKRTKGMNEKIDILLAIDNDSKINEETAKDRLKVKEESKKIFEAYG